MKAEAHGEHTSGPATGSNHVDRWPGTLERHRYSLAETETRYGFGFFTLGDREPQFTRQGEMS